MIHIEKNGKVIGSGYNGRTYQEIAERIEKDDADLLIVVRGDDIVVTPREGEDIIYSRQMKIIANVCIEEGVNFYATTDRFREVPEILIY